MGSGEQVEQSTVDFGMVERDRTIRAMWRIVGIT